MRQIYIMIKPASSLCNMQCQYCFYADVRDRRAVPSCGMMRKDTAKALIKNVFCDLDGGDEVTFAFQGGEPTLAGLSFFQFFVEEARQQAGKIVTKFAIQTNGLVLDDSWCEFLSKNRFLVGLSLDGDASMHNQNRLCTDGSPSHARVMQAKRRLERYRIEYNILWVLTNGIARHPQKVWAFIEKEGIQYVQFIPCLGRLDAPSIWALTPKRFCSFYRSLYVNWREGILSGRRVSIKLFDDIVNLFVREQVTSCGMHGHCQPQYVVEADGSLYPCDFFALDEYRVGNLGQIPLRQAFDSMMKSDFYKEQDALPPICTACQYRPACHGGCKRMRSAMYFDGPDFCGFQQLLHSILDDICLLAQNL